MNPAKYLDGQLVEREGPLPPSFEQLLVSTRAVCLAHPEIVRLEVFGSVADEQTAPGSDVDLLATFLRRQLPRGLAYFGHLEDLQLELSAALGAPVDLHDRASVEVSDNAFRRESILRSARLLYAAEPEPLIYSHGM